MRYFLGLSSAYSAADTLRHTFATGSEYDLSELRAFLAAHYGSTFDHVAVYSNGRTALNVAIKELVKRGGKIAVTSLTCYAVIQAIKNAGCVPIFADVDRKTLHFGKEELEKALEGETNVQAVIVQNNLGIPADIEGIEEVAKAKKLIIIEDLAHSAGVRYADGREAGTVGRATILSFGKGKSIDTVTGGAVIFSNPLDPPVNQPGEPPVFKENFRARFYPLLASIIRGGYRLNRKFGRILQGGFVKIHAIKRSADGDIDANLRLTFWQCKLASKKLKNLPHRGRKPLRDFYLVDDRDAVLGQLERTGYLFSDIWYDTPVAPKRYFHKADFHPDACPAASEIATQIVNVPNWYDKDDMRPALRIIKEHLIDEDAISRDDLAISEKEKYQKEIETRKKEKRAAMKKTAKAKIAKVAPNQVIKIAKKKKAEAEQKVGQKREEAKKTKEEVEKERIKRQEKRAEQKKEKELEKQEKISKERDDSGLLLAMEKAKRNEEPVVLNKDEKKVEQTLAKEPAPAKEPVKTAPAKPSRPSPSMRQAKEVEPPKPKKADSMPGMRVAPEKLSAREKLKAELKEGRKEGSSVV